MPQKLEARLVVQVVDVPLSAGEEVIDARHLVTLLQQPVAKVRAEEAGTAGDEDAFAGLVETGHRLGSGLSMDGFTMVSF